MKQTASRVERTAKWPRRLSPGPWADRLPRRWRNLMIISSGAAALIGCACAVYLSCRSTGQLSSVAWLPDAVGQWADRHGRFRNLPAYFLLAFPILPVMRDAGARIYAAFVIGAFSALLELAEYFVPSRTVEWQDVAWSCAGVMMAWLLVEAVIWAVARLTRETGCRQAS